MKSVWKAIIGIFLIIFFANALSKSSDEDFKKHEQFTFSVTSTDWTVYVVDGKLTIGTLTEEETQSVINDPNALVCSVNAEAGSCFLWTNCKQYSRLSSTKVTAYYIDNLNAEKLRRCSGGTWQDFKSYATSHGVDLSNPNPKPPVVFVDNPKARGAEISCSNICKINPKI